jgi:hypothetical protein
MRIAISFRNLWMGGGVEAYLEWLMPALRHAS